MEFLAEELNDPDAGPCGKCLSCAGRLLPEDYPQDLAQAAVEFLYHQEYAIQPRKRWPPGLTDPEMRGNIAAAQQAQEGRTLGRWGDPGFGALVRRGKQQEHRFDEQLVEAAALLVENRWRPDPVPTWITCVPSRRHPTLVPDFARRLARRLGLLFVECIHKVGILSPRKLVLTAFSRRRTWLGLSLLTRRRSDQDRCC